MSSFKVHRGDLVTIIIPGSGVEYGPYPIKTLIIDDSMESRFTLDTNQYATISPKPQTVVVEIPLDVLRAAVTALRGSAGRFDSADKCPIYPDWKLGIELGDALWRGLSKEQGNG